MKEIVDLENKPVTRLYSKVEEKVDNITGEVTTIVSSFLQKEKTKDDFIKLFVENINYLADNLSNSALRVVLMMFKNLNYQNIFHYNSDFVSYFTNKKILGKSSVYRAIKELEDKNVIFKITKEQQEEYDIISPNSYIMNPQIIGKGSFKDLKKLRQTTIKEFDFEKLEMIQKVEVEGKYEGLEKVKKNPEDYYIEDIKQIFYPNAIENQVIISKKEAEADNQALITNYAQPSLFDNKEDLGDFWNMCGALTGAYHPTKSAKELKREKLDKDLEEGRI
ncbi:replication/maintenance protein RepL [Campylobacter insulaenigrae]|uniref:replication/maintenance protein RepL n=1 Tax=Campylobacter insulaenigrae TaxID=260714 RepID=UPI0021535B8D|nr:replication/maintenance protein RepL [Campylobacter insulaenigrae]MCR6577854.1 replication/maintenance protein RepL [Campylobacter insulaenigrae]